MQCRHLMLVVMDLKKAIERKPVSVHDLLGLCAESAALVFVKLWRFGYVGVLLVNLVPNGAPSIAGLGKFQ